MPGSLMLTMPISTSLTLKNLSKVGDYQLMFTFPNNLVSAGGASVTAHGPTSGTGVVDTSMRDPTNAHNYVVNLKNVSDAQYLTVTLTGVLDTLGDNGTVVSPQLGILLGDVNGSGRTDNGDAIVVRNLSGTVPSDSTTARADVNCSGRIDNGDAIVVRNNSGNALP
jgi:hypothetical protein